MTTTAEGSKPRDDKVVYFGVININEVTSTVGAVEKGFLFITYDHFFVAVSWLHIFAKN